MLKKTLLLFLAAAAAFAVEFVTLGDGRTVMLKDDGTYEEVTLIIKDGKTIALKNDGTWIRVDEDVPVVESVGTKRAQKSFNSSKLAKILPGRWESRDGSTVYEFGTDGTVRIKRDNRWKRLSYRIDDVDEQKRNIVVNIGENSRIGFLSIGGEQRVLHIEDDGKTMHDESYRLKHLRDLVLIKQ